jgi:hypothetical protein
MDAKEAETRAVACSGLQERVVFYWGGPMLWDGVFAASRQAADKRQKADFLRFGALQLLRPSLAEITARLTLLRTAKLGDRHHNNRCVCSWLPHDMAVAPLHVTTVTLPHSVFGEPPDVVGMAACRYFMLENALYVLVRAPLRWPGSPEHASALPAALTPPRAPAEVPRPRRAVRRRRRHRRERGRRRRVHRAPDKRAVRVR